MLYVKEQGLKDRDIQAHRLVTVSSYGSRISDLSLAGLATYVSLFFCSSYF
jgi:hypothetical protein